MITVQFRGYLGFIKSFCHDAKKEREGGKEEERKGKGKKGKGRKRRRGEGRGGNLCYRPQ